MNENLTRNPTKAKLQVKFLFYQLTIELRSKEITNDFRHSTSSTFRSTMNS